MGDIDIDCIICNIDPRVNNYYFFYRSSIEIRKIAFLSHGRFSLIMHTNVCDVFAPYSCTLTPLGCTLSFSLKKPTSWDLHSTVPYLNIRHVYLSFSSLFFVESLLCTLRVHLFHKLPTGQNITLKIARNTNRTF